MPAPKVGYRADARMTDTGKVCARCGEDKPLDRFTRASRQNQRGGEVAFRARCIGARSTA